ncbi:hypothetical protein DET61_101214 [Marinobacter nauticus]|uniref:Uncharacterized protein n=1 Tax=Marinobacter nauticus TaxID=2743 RepID=A0A368Y640_MARNT|nr:hypothetical protein DET61_101214 [Marinobacter nauticus]
MVVDTMIKDWFLIIWHYKDRVIGKSLYGTVVQDTKDRFPSGVECKSSAIEAEITAPGANSRVFQTQNSLWECVGDGREVHEPHTAIPLFNQGVRPPYTDVLESVAALEAEGYTVVDSEPKQ